MPERETIIGLKRVMRRSLPPFMHRRFVSISRAVAAWWYRNDLNQLALIFGTDKWGSHWYTEHYQSYFRPFKQQQLSLLEIGVGGYKDPAAGGESLRMWKAFFPRARIVGIDVEDKTIFRAHRIDIRQCDQTDSEALIRLCDEYGGFDIVIDDGSHVNEHVIKTFRVLFPRLRRNGIYVVEDMQTSYWPTYGGGIGNPRSSMSFFKSLIDGLNHAEYPVEDYTPDYFDQNIVEIAFFHNLVLIRKGENSSKSNQQDISREVAAAKTNHS